MISISLEVDIEKAQRFLRLLPEQADRAAARAINKVADDMQRWSAREIANDTGLPVGSRSAAKKGQRGERNTVNGRMFIRGATARRLMASVHALPSAKNVGHYKGAAPRQTKPGVDVKAWRRRTVYDKAFVKGPARIAGGIPRKVWRRTGPGDNDITDKVWGPSVRRSFLRPFVQAGQVAIIRQRWPVHFERYIRAEIVKSRGAEALRGVGRILPDLTGPTIL
jgi:hypothetical protein